MGTGLRIIQSLGLTALVALLLAACTEENKKGTSTNTAAPFGGTIGSGTLGNYQLAWGGRLYVRSSNSENWLRVYEKFLESTCQVCELHLCGGAYDPFFNNCSEWNDDAWMEIYVESDTVPTNAVIVFYAFYDYNQFNVRQLPFSTVLSPSNQNTKISAIFRGNSFTIGYNDEIRVDLLQSELDDPLVAEVFLNGDKMGESVLYTTLQ